MVVVEMAEWGRISLTLQVFIWSRPEAGSDETAKRKKVVRETYVVTDAFVGKLSKGRYMEEKGGKQVEQSQNQIRYVTTDSQILSL